jgi:hypothetical protein
MQFGELKMRFCQTLHFTQYDIYETFLSVSMILNVFFIWNMNYIRVLVFFFKSYHHPNFEQLTRVWSVAGRFGVWNTNTAFNYRSWIIEKYLLEKHRLFVSKAMNSKTLTN